MREKTYQITPVLIVLNILTAYHCEEVFEGKQTGKPLWSKALTLELKIQSLCRPVGHWTISAYHGQLSAMMYPIVNHILMKSHS